MSLTKEQEKRAKENFADDIKNVGQEDVDYAYRKGLGQLKKFGDHPPAAIKKFWEDIKLMIGMIKDYVQGNYKDVPWNTIAAVTGAVIYFVSPIDIIPDVIPVVGYLDDALVIKLALDFIGDDLMKYKKWQAAQIR